MNTAAHSLDFQDMIGSLHHHKVEALLTQLCEQARIDDPQGLCDFWTRFEAELTGHLDEEESALLPAFAVEHPEEAAAILADHKEIRRSLEELGVSVDLRELPPHVADDLARRLRAHADREDRTLYPWATTHSW